LQRAPVGERQLPGEASDTVHLVETARRLLIAHPPGQEHDPGHLRRHVRPQDPDRRLRDRAIVVLHRVALAGHDHVDLQQRAGQLDPVRIELAIQRVQGPAGGVLARREIVVAVHQDLGLDDRHDVGLLAQGRVARHRVRVRIDGEGGRGVGADDDRRTPLGEPGPESAVLRESFP